MTLSGFIIIILRGPGQTTPGICVSLCLTDKESRWLTFEDDGVAFENFELVHFGLSHLDDRIVVLLRVLDLQLVRSLLAVQNRCRVVLILRSARSSKQQQR